MQRVCFDLKEFSNEAVVKHEHFWCICFEIHLSVQASFHGAGLKNPPLCSSTVPSPCTSIVYKLTDEKGEVRQKSLNVLKLHYILLPFYVCDVILCNFLHYVTFTFFKVYILETLCLVTQNVW